MSPTARGVLAIICACMIWGLSGMFYKLLVHLPAIEMMAHRTIWAAVFFLIVLGVQGRATAPFAALTRRRDLPIIVLASLMVGANWFTFVFAVQIGKALDASLGYFIFPLVAVFLGLLVFGERLSRVQTAAVILAAVGVITLTAGLGVPPWISLILGITFGIYGMLKKGLDLGPITSVTAEAILLVPLAVGLLIWVHLQGGDALGVSWAETGLLMLSGPITATPLILFSYGARRVALASVGLLSYLNPTLQFLVATLVFHEFFGLWHGVAFGMIWTALALYSWSRWHQDKARSRLSQSA
ncbi:EamA family transporter RarD [Roseovarius aestuariivivens]|uniref:EamA family transporter RarD n=1 Tax=Roseovarius aestuariivivens TaxID=1888910 RepID=UPI0010807010|nr:EamA family transporter RarD [Roseovarius aestuariivivens]